MPRGMTPISRGHIEESQFGDDAQSSRLRYEQQFAVSIVEEAVAHGSVRGVDMDAHARLHGRIAAAS